MEPGLDPRAEEPAEHLDPEEQRRRDEDEPEREREDVPGRRAANDEELGRVPEEIEERLRHGERGQHEEMEAADGDLLGTMDAHAAT